jgi:hypothetical protein
MEGSNSLVNFGELSKPADTLIKKISDALGGAFKPWQIRRVAEAEADAEIIRAKANIKITDLQHRAVERFFYEEAKKQDNIENISSKALPLLNSDSKPEQVEDDWITNFFDKCRLISDDKMQTIWSKILAGESNSPGNYSKKTIDILASMDKSDAELFTKLAGFCFFIDGSVIPLIYDNENKIYVNNGIQFSTLTHLESIGLIRFDSLGGFTLSEMGQKICIYYLGKKLWIEMNETENNKLRIGQVMLTRFGEQLISICASNPVEGFIDFVKEKWQSFGIKVLDEKPSNKNENI